MQLEQQVYSIEAANINYETLQAMKQAGSAMEQIHGGMNIEQVDETMYVDRTLLVLLSFSCFITTDDLCTCRAKLQEQHALADEVSQAIITPTLGDQVDEDELDAELEGLEQEAMDERMLNTGPVPVNSQLDRLPAAGTSDCKFIHTAYGRSALSDISRYGLKVLTSAAVSKNKATAEEDDEEAELAKLREEMAM